MKTFTYYIIFIVIIDEAINFFSSYLFTTDSNYSEYIRNAKIHIKELGKDIDSNINRLKINIANKKKSYENIKKLIEKDETLKKHYDLDKYLNELGDLEDQYNELLVKRRDAPKALPTFEEYLKLFNSTPVILGKIRDMKQMDFLLRIFFLNFTITATGNTFAQGSKVTYKLKEPWKGFLENGDFVLGAAAIRKFSPNMG